MTLNIRLQKYKCTVKRTSGYIMSNIENVIKFVVNVRNVMVKNQFQKFYILV
jgi:hypothetical protein